ncbi:MAG TPA: bifunctional phosphoribosylaminoimidazolecarboxamide formyltransferase/IMP cyclohydrolase [Actinomycetota bacterium]|nr:bifunctional phosphoribosylaminoimidazolecarboxamide formyltransferase/IMP cyclohydrolase [Actinomycetota bacterium]
MSDVRPVRRALLAVYDKSGVVELARALVEEGVALVSSGGTAQTLRDAGIPVTPVEEVTGSPEMLDGRVKTLHPRIHAGILADRRKPDHEAQLAEHGIEPFELVVVNLYPFRETVASGAGPEDVIEKIDIGGPTMVRAAAKNFASVGVVVSPARYDDVLAEIRREGGLSRELRRALAAEAFAHTAAYDAAVAGWFATEHDTLPGFVGMAFEKREDLRYGENPHQRGALYAEAAGAGPLGGAEVLVAGKEMSFNNWLDLDAAYALAGAFEEPAAVIVKHNNPCGAAVGGSLADAYGRAFESDSVSAFGGIVAFNREADEEAAGAMADVFTEVVVAPGFTEGALAGFGTRRSLRVVRAPLPSAGGLDVRVLPGGALVQDRDVIAERREDMEIVSDREPTEDEWRDLLFAWTVAMRVKSNAIVFARDLATVGVGAGQMSRVDSSFLAVRKAGDRAKGSVMASDAFFPFPDAVEVAADAGVTAVIHPGGSIRDDDVLSVAESRGMAVVLTGRRHFRH